MHIHAHIETERVYAKRRLSETPEKDCTTISYAYPWIYQHGNHMRKVRHSRYTCAVPECSFYAKPVELKSSVEKVLLSAWMKRTNSHIFTWQRWSDGEIGSIGTQFWKCRCLSVNPWLSLSSTPQKGWKPNTTFWDVKLYQKTYKACASYGVLVVAACGTHQRQGIWEKTYLWLTLTEFPPVDPFPRVVVAPNVNTNKTIIKMTQFNSTKPWWWCKWRQFYGTKEYIFSRNKT